MSKQGIKNYFSGLIKRIIDDDFPGMASEMAYMFVLGIFPLMILLVAIFGFFGKKGLLSYIFAVVDYIAPHDAVDLICRVLNEVIIFEHGGLMAIIGGCIVLGLSSNIFAVITKGLNRAYGLPETRSFLHTRLLSVVMLFINAFFLFISTNLIVFGKIIIDFISNYIPEQQVLINTVLIIRWPISFLALFLVVYMNYYYLPCILERTKARQKSAIVGSLFFSVFWLLGSWSFSIYLDNLNTYNKVYGTLGAVAILMVWFYYTSIIILIGGEINSQVYSKITEKNSKI